MKKELIGCDKEKLIYKMISTNWTFYILLKTAAYANPKLHKRLDMCPE